MNKEGKNQLMYAAASGLCGLGLLSSATASSPFNAGGSPATVEAARSLSVTTRSFLHQEHTSNTLLDLRLPADSSRAIIHHGAAASASPPSPSAIHHLDLGKADRDTDDRVPLPALGASELSFQVMSRAEIFVRGVHREGLPIAGLWESKSALLSIGLNRRGQSGLWLSQRNPSH